MAMRKITIADRFEEARRHRLPQISLLPNEDVVDWLLECPEKEFFVPIESEPTDTL
jgi:hypothetical protein